MVSKLSKGRTVVKKGRFPWPLIIDLSVSASRKPRPLCLTSLLVPHYGDPSLSRGQLDWLVQEMHQQHKEDPSVGPPTLWPLRSWVTLGWRRVLILPLGFDEAWTMFIWGERFHHSCLLSSRTASPLRLGWLVLWVYQLQSTIEFPSIQGFQQSLPRCLNSIPSLLAGAYSCVGNICGACQSCSIEEAATAFYPLISIPL